MDPLSTVGSAAVVLQFIQYAAKACDFVTNLREDNSKGFYEGIFTEMAEHFFNFSIHFKPKRQAEFTPGSTLNQEVGRLCVVYKSMLGG